jgi:putative transcriptional regulator
LNVQLSQPPRQHPSEELLTRHVSGDLPLSRRAVVESHLAFCARCRGARTELAWPGGRHLAGQEPVPPPPGLWGRLAERLDAESDRRRNALLETPLPPAVAADLPAIENLAWSSLPGSPVELVRLWQEADLGLELYLLRCPPGARFPYHRHLGKEDLLILRGGFEDELGHLAAGEMRTYPPGSAHAPRIDDGDVCWAITAIEKGVEFAHPGTGRE